MDCGRRPHDQEYLRNLNQKDDVLTAQFGHSKLGVSPAPLGYWRGYSGLLGWGRSDLTPHPAIQAIKNIKRIFFMGIL